jgi:adsorption protein B
VPHDGPTSKADCLNWIYQSMLLYEQEHGCRFDIVVTHDAEDLIHPQSLKWINSYADEYEMVQIPVLALPTGFREFTHGVYCDEFAEYQMKDVPARQILGSFVPSNGVGTGYTRRALELLAESSSNRIFEPTCLTEDYENGIRLHELGCRQMFVPLKKLDDAFVATREYFPRDRRAATRQRTRWITGISLQGWERHGWRGSAVDVYWLWRDRKSLVGTPVTILANLLFAYGVLTAVWSYATGRPWGLGSVAGKWEAVFAATFSLQILSILFRSYCVTKVYGLLFALGVGLRVPWANWINCVATVRALRDFSRTKIHGEPLRWLKTEHAYPSLDALIEHKRRLGEVLVQSGYLSQASLDRALVTKPSDTRLGEHLVELRLLTEVELYEALSLQQSVDLEFPEPLRIRRAIACSLPRHVIEEWKVLPFKIESGALFLAGPEVPTEEMLDALRRFTRLELRFHLTPPGLFERLTAELL